MSYPTSSNLWHPLEMFTSKPPTLEQLPSHASFCHVDVLATSLSVAFFVALRRVRSRLSPRSTVLMRKLAKKTF